ncbi:MAG: hypothetical protein M2R45_01346 [Verrucomicrobia subdivision 3 bacterium]|nr:hypothetical protein [Limisphaerales bacterium]MCS1416035.1 hypothetical protein [Limisphaerales bacterium]
MILRVFIVVVSTIGFGIHCLLGAQLILFDFDGAAGNETSFGAVSQPTNGTVSEITRGSGIIASPASGTFSARSWSSESIDLDDYFSFSIEPDPGFQLNLSSLELDERRSATGIRNWSVRSSLDEFAFDLSPSPFSVPDNTETRLDQEISFSVTDFSELTDRVEFRIYGYMAEANSGTWRIDNVELFGDVVAVPEPAGWFVVGSSVLMGWVINRHRRRRADSE